MAGKRISEKEKIIAKIEAEISLREMTGQKEFSAGLKAAIALVDPEYYRAKYLKPATEAFE
jgi:hypothetical protein